jgi:hypothetical protein
MRFWLAWIGHGRDSSARLTNGIEEALKVTRWLMSSSSDRRALDVVDGTGICAGHGPHYSRRTPGSRTFTGVGQEIVLVTECGRAVWACIRQKTPMAVGSGRSRHRKADDAKQTDVKARYVWRNMMFRNLGAGLSSELIIEATERTYREWLLRYGKLPDERLRTEIGIKEVRSTNPGFCYRMAGWERGEAKRGKLFLYAPPPIVGVVQGKSTLQTELSI